MARGCHVPRPSCSLSHEDCSTTGNPPALAPLDGAEEADKAEGLGKSPVLYLPTEIFQVRRQPKVQPTLGHAGGNFRSCSLGEAFHCPLLGLHQREVLLPHESGRPGNRRLLYHQVPGSPLTFTGNTADPLASICSLLSLN